MVISDIMAAIERGDTAALEEAFGILVGWPGAGRIEGSSPKTRKAALGRVCEALATDDAAMPEPVARLVRAVGEGPTDGSYAAGAYHAKQNRGHFHRILERSEA